MATSVIMPKAGMAMERGTIIRWLKKVGDPVIAGEPLLEIETDKVAMEVEAEVSGTLIQVVREAGEEVLVTETIGFIGAEGEAAPGPGGSGQLEAGAGGRKGGVRATPAARRRAAELGVALEAVTPSGRSGEVKLRDAEARRSPAISSLARKIAEQEGVDPAGIRGSGTGGRIVKRDLAEALARLPASGRALARSPLSGPRKIIAERMLRSHLSIPQVTLNARADVTSLLRLRAEMNREIEERISVNDLILRATALALLGSRAMLATIEGEEIVAYEEINLGMAVAVDSGLVVPVIRGADKLALPALARLTAELSGRARERTLKPDDLVGGTFTVTNLGMYGITSFTPIVNPGEGAILGVNAAESEVRLEAGLPVERKVMTLSLSIDHRVIDGAEGARFLQSLVGLLEKPYRVLL